MIFVFTLVMTGLLLTFLPDGLAIPEQPYVVSGGYERAQIRTEGTCSADLAVIGSGYQADAALAADGFTVLSWNAQKGRRTGWSADLAALTETSDIVLLQEATLDDALRQQLHLMSHDWLLAPAFQTADRDVGILSLARVSPQSYCAVRQPEPLIRIPKVALASTYPVTGTDERLLVVNVHVINFTVALGSVRRQFEAIRDMVHAHHGPVIVAGDFNTWSKGRTALVDEAMTSLGLRPVAFDPDYRAQFFNRAVDGVYYRGLEVVGSLSQAVQTSDHNPLKVRFRVAAEHHLAANS